MALAASLIFGLTITLAVFGAILLATPGRAEQIARRLEGGAARASYEPSTGRLLIRDEGLSSLPWLDRALARWPKMEHVKDVLSQAGLESNPSQILLTIVVAALTAYLIAYAFSGSLVVSAIGAVVVGSIPILTIYFRRRSRLRAFERTFPEAIDLLSRAVRAGHALYNGMEIVGQEMNEPLAGEFRKTFEEQRLGLQFREALINLTKRVPLQDVRFFAAALIIQEETGGNLAEILGNLSSTVRDRFKIRGEVRVRTAQGRLTAGILMALPPLILILLNFLNPGYCKALFTDTYGMTALASAAGLQVIGGFLLWKIVRIDV